MSEANTGILVTTDERGRASLGHAGTTYPRSEYPDGTIVLEPASVISDLERRYLENTALVAQIAYARSHPEQQRRRRQA